MFSLTIISLYNLVLLTYLTFCLANLNFVDFITVLICLPWFFAGPLVDHLITAASRVLLRRRTASQHRLEQPLDLVAHAELQGEQRRAGHAR